MRASAFVLVVLCLLQASCGCRHQFSQSSQEPGGPCSVEFVGLYVDRAELVPGLRNARSVHEIRQLLRKSDEPGGTNIYARFTVEEVVSDSGDRPRPGDEVCIVFRSPTDPNAAAPLPGSLVGKRLRIVLHGPFRYRYYGRFSYSE